MNKIINAQNFPRNPKIRRLIIPSQPGNVLLEGDLVQAESMVVAWYAKERNLMMMYLEGADVHSWVGSLIMEEQITKADVEKRTMAKRIVHGSNYGMYPQMIVRTILKELCVALPLWKAKRAQTIYFQHFPMIRLGYHKGIEEELRTQNRVIRTPTGFERKFFAPWGRELFKEAYAHYAQNIIAYITNQAMNRLQELGYVDYIYMQTHDAVVLDIPKTKIVEMASILRQVMTYPVTIKNKELVIPVEIKIGKNYGEMEEYNETLWK